MRSTFTSTNEDRLHWETVGGAHPGAVAEYGPWQFRVYRWHSGCYVAYAFNPETGEEERWGDKAGEVTALWAGKALCEKVYQRVRAEDRAAGITRG